MTKKMSIFRRINSLHNQIKISTLAFASLNVFVVGYIGIYFINKINQWRVQKIEHYKEAVPFRIGLADTFDRRNNYVGKTESKFLIPLFGTNCDASLNVFAQRECDLSKFLLKKLELETAEGDRYLIFERVNEIKNLPEELPKQKRPRLCRE